MRRVLIPAGRYARFTASGDPGQVVWRTWEFIHEVWSLRTERRYQADFERYLAFGPAGVTVEILVGLL
jgi:predicted transcriptional regulator YdeE